MSAPSFVGIDFGTTNSAVALAEPGGAVRLAPLPVADDSSVTAPTWRTILHFPAERGPVRAGAPAIARWADSEGEGRLVQSIKSHLASASFDRTVIGGKIFRLEDLVAVFLRQIARAAGVENAPRVVIGRPVRYWGAETPEDEARALGRMKEAAALAGFGEVAFEYEPVAAAASYGARLDHEELVMVADFGGGTSDFSLVKVGPRGQAVLASEGIGIGGDAFDARVIDAEVAPALGRGTAYKDGFGAVTDIPAWIFSRLRRWHLLSFLKAPETVRLLERVEQGALAPEKVERLLRVIRDDLGLPLHQAVERTKIALSTGAKARLDVPALELAVAIARLDFNEWIQPDLDAIDGVVERLLGAAGVAARDVDKVFATGGSSLVPAVRMRLGARFGDEHIVGGEELTSVAWGMAVRARELFASS